MSENSVVCIEEGWVKMLDLKQQILYILCVCVSIASCVVLYTIVMHLPKKNMLQLLAALLLTDTEINNILV